MSKYTMELRELFTKTNPMYYPLYTREEVLDAFRSYELSDILTSDEINVINLRGTFSKDRLATMIVNHYLFREIGLETPALFLDRARTTMNEIMMEYLPLIYTSSISYPVLEENSVHEEISRNLEKNDEVESSSEESRLFTSELDSINNSMDRETVVNFHKESDTPQGEITNATELLANGYTSYVEMENNSRTNGIDKTLDENRSENEIKIKNDMVSSNGTVDEVSERNVTRSKDTLKSKMILEYRKTILNYYNEIIKRLDTLFMQIY